VIDTARVQILSRDSPRRVDVLGYGALAGASARARSVDRGNGAVRSAHETVIHVACVKVFSRDRSCRVDACGLSAPEGARCPRLEHRTR